MAEPWELAHRVADDLEPKAKKQFLDVVARLLIAADLTQITSLLSNNDLAGVMRLYQDAVGTTTMPSILSLGRLIESGMVRSADRTLRGEDGSALIFDLNNPYSQDWIRHEAANLVINISNDTVEAVRTYMDKAYSEGRGAAWAGRQIRSVVGLLPQHAAAVARYVNAMRESGLPEGIVTRTAETYARRLLNWRAKNIARTESIKAAMAGLEQSWAKAARDGFLDRNRAWKQWMVAEDDRLCPVCAPMDGVKVRLGDLFMATVEGFPEGKPEAQGPGSWKRKGPLRPDPYARARDERGRFSKADDGLKTMKRPIVVPHPPLHPSCRCALVLVFDPIA